MLKVKNLVKKIILSCLIFVLLALSFAPKVHAQGNWYAPTYGEWSEKVFDNANPQEIFGERYTYAQVLWIVYSLISILTGDDLLGCINSSGNSQELRDCVESFNPQGGTSVNSANIASWADVLLNARAASGVSYASDLASRFKLVPEAYAQGFGFRTLEPVLTIWKITRNITYLLLVVVILALAFMIMFRVKISPQVVITVQSALPKVAITLVLITFSYAIAGFIIDLSYLFVGLIALFIKSVGADVTSLGVVDLFNQLLQGHPIMAILFVLTLFALIVFVLGGVTALLTVWAGGAGTAGLVIGGVGVVLVFLIAIFLIIAAIRIMWLMFRTFVSIVLLVIVGPLMILLGALSPSFGGFGQWIKTLLSHVAVYPVVILMMFLAHFFFWGFFLSGTVGDLLSADWLNIYQINTGGLAATTSPIALPGFGQPASHLFGFVLSFGIILLTPSVGNMIQSMIQGKPFAYGTAIGEAIGMVPRGIYTGADIVARAGKTVEGLRGIGLFTGKPKKGEEFKIEPVVEERLRAVARPTGVNKVKL